MTGFILYATDKETGEHFYVGDEMDRGDYVGEKWLTKDPTVIRVYFDEKRAEEEIDILAFDYPKVDVKVISIDMPTFPSL